MTDILEMVVLLNRHGSRRWAFVRMRPWWFSKTPDAHTPSLIVMRHIDDMAFSMGFEGATWDFKGFFRLGDKNPVHDVTMASHGITSCHQNQIIKVTIH